MSKKKQESNEQGAPEWMVTFSDCMTLLLTFFVLLLSFSSFDDETFKKLKIVFGQALPSITTERGKSKEAILKPVQEAKVELDSGSERPTFLLQGSEKSFRDETESQDFHNRKVFVTSSEEIFWGRGAIISSEGRQILTELAEYLKEVRGRMVISESGGEDYDEGGQLGLSRAWAIMEYFTLHQGLDKSWFSISSASMIRVQEGKGESFSDNERTVEITILEQSLYN